MGDVNHEPTMEEILASIKKIIAEDGGAAGQRSRTKRPVLEAEAEMSAPEPTAEAAEVEAEPEASILELTEAVEPESEDAPLVSEETERSSRAALEALTSVKAKGPLALGPEAIEAAARDMLRPMLQQWLDDNLPDIVESMVAREISRITGETD